MFSTRVPDSLDPTLLARAVAALRAAGTPFADLTESNPTRAGLAYEETLLTPLCDPEGLVYAPDALGMPAAREAVAADYARRGVLVPPDRVVVTASTSESYSLLFKLLCDPGEAVLVPEPSYPLFRCLTRLDGIEGRPYRLAADEGWLIDVASIGRLIDDRTRAVLVVTPNNPTGTRLSRASLLELSALCARRRIALIGDEVFADYPLGLKPDAAPSVLEGSKALTFSLGGLSKTAGLPQVKLGWMAAGGPDELVGPALTRLEVVADAYLSVSTPVQMAAARLLERGTGIRAQILDRIRRNYMTLVDAAALHPSCRIPVVEGGWSAVIQAPAVMPDEVRALRLLERHRVLVHPGSLFDFEREGYFVVSLLPHPTEFEPAVRRLLAALAMES